jgi:hypothetical protein
VSHQRHHEAGDHEEDVDADFAIARQARKNMHEPAMRGDDAVGMKRDDAERGKRAQRLD